MHNSEQVVSGNVDGTQAHTTCMACCCIIVVKSVCIIPLTPYDRFRQRQIDLHTTTGVSGFSSIQWGVYLSYPSWRFNQFSTATRWSSRWVARMYDACCCCRHNMIIHPPKICTTFASLHALFPHVMMMVHMERSVCIKCVCQSKREIAFSLSQDLFPSVAINVGKQLSLNAFRSLAFIVVVHN